MKILKHGNPDIIKNWITIFTCTRCECEFAANLGDLTEDIATKGTVVDLFVQLIDKPTETDMNDVIVYKTHCPECGQELSKTKAEIIAEEQKRGIN